MFYKSWGRFDIICPVFFNGVHSGKVTWLAGKSPFCLGNTSSKGPRSIAIEGYGAVPTTSENQSFFFINFEMYEQLHAQSLTA